MSLAPIVLFLYKRPDRAAKVIEALISNSMAEDSDLFVFIDGPKNESEITSVNKTVEIAHNIDGFSSISVEVKKNNMGLARSIIEGVSQILDKYGKVIVLEDDLVISKRFLEYMNSCLNAYKQNKNIFSVSGYNYPPAKMIIPNDYNHDIFLTPRAHSWGWATWVDRWDSVDWSMSTYASFEKNKSKKLKFSRGGDDLLPMLSAQMKGKIDSWAIRFVYAQYLAESYTIYPVKSMVRNDGFGEDASHCFGDDSEYLINLDDKWLPESYPKNLSENVNIINNWADVFKEKPKKKKSLLSRLLRKLQ